MLARSCRHSRLADRRLPTRPAMKPHARLPMLLLM